jgi:hypothetical protein
VTTSRRRSRLAAAAFLLVAVLAFAGAQAPAGAGDGDDAGTGSGGQTTTTLVLGDPDDGIIPRPNSGHDPAEAGDRGGALQLAVLGLLVAGVGFVGFKVFRQVSA